MGSQSGAKMRKPPVQTSTRFPEGSKQYRKMAPLVPWHPGPHSIRMPLSARMVAARAFRVVAVVDAEFAGDPLLLRFRVVRQDVHVVEAPRRDPPRAVLLRVARQRRGDAVPLRASLFGHERLALPVQLMGETARGEEAQAVPLPRLFAALDPVIVQAELLQTLLVGPHVLGSLDPPAEVLYARMVGLLQD